MRCQECGFKNPDGKNNCEKCGSKLYDLSSANFNPDALRVNQTTDSLRTIKVEKENTKQENTPVEPSSHHLTQPLSALSFDDGEPRRFFLINEKTGEKLTFTSGENLKRDKLAPGNVSISENAHAEIFFESGKWKIKDKSTNGAVFVQVKDEPGLRKGMRIILGNQIFRFED
jgi:hypothetical protein